jgi:hypothetical protein
MTSNTVQQIGVAWVSIPQFDRISATALWFGPFAGPSEPHYGLDMMLFTRRWGIRSDPIKGTPPHGDTDYIILGPNGDVIPLLAPTRTSDDRLMPNLHSMLMQLHISLPLADEADLAKALSGALCYVYRDRTISEGQVTEAVYRFLTIKTVNAVLDLKT